ncbi:MAG TPA: NADH-quinone oxidoreductase subunit E, partial [Marmoricola sp.]
GFPDDLADEGPSAGPASLLGLGIARERGWRAPAATASGATGESASGKVEAAEQADTSRAESETKAEEGR